MGRQYSVHLRPSVPPDAPGPAVFLYFIQIKALNQNCPAFPVCTLQELPGMIRDEGGAIEGHTGFIRFRADTV